MEKEHGFLGRGWDFPPEFDPNTKDVKMINGEEDIKSSLHILLSTRLGERIMQPKFGCQLDELQFNPLNRTTVTYISELIKTAILYHEPRIEVEKLDMSVKDDKEGVILIQLEYRVRATNSRMNMVFPFYKNEARGG